MVSLKQRQTLASLAEADSRLKRFQLLLAEEDLRGDDAVGGGVHEELLLAISSNDSVRFRNVATRIGQRKVSADSDWCQDDYLLFLLLLGNEMFGRPMTFLASVIEVRRSNPNPLPRKINDVFAALERQEFGIDGEFCFLKLLTQKAYDVVLTERQPLAMETTTQLIEGFEVHAKDLSLRQWWRVVTALPGRMILALVVVIVGAGVIPVLICVGEGLVEFL